MLRARTLVLLTAIAAAALPLSPAPAAAQANDALKGTFTLNRQASDDVNAAINQAVQRMNFVTRPVARGRLRNTNQPYQRIVIDWSGGNVSVTTDARAPIVSPAAGTAVAWRREDGEQFQLTQRWEGGKLHQRFSADDGSRENVFSVSPDGQTMTMEVTVTSPRLPQPLRYKLVYTRAS